MRSFSTNRLFLVLFMVSGLLVVQTARAQQKKAPPAQKKNATAQPKTAPGTQPTAAKGAANARAGLDIVPEGALGFGVIRNLGELDAKLSSLASDLQIPTPGPLMTIRALSGIQEGLNEKGAIVTAVMPGKEEGDMPVTAVFVPVTDFDKFVAQLRRRAAAETDRAPDEVTIANRNFAVAKKGNYAVLAETRDTDRLKEIAAAKSGSLGLAAGLTQWIGDHDAYLVIMPDAIKRMLGPVREGLQQAKAAFPADNEQLRNVAAIFDIYDKMFATIEAEITHFAVGLRIDEGALYLNSHSVFLPNGSLAQAAKDARRPDQRALTALPAGPYMMVFDGVFPESWFKGMASFSAEAMRMFTPPGGEKLSDEQIRKMTDAMQKSMSGVQSLAMRVGAFQPGKSIYAGMSGAMKVNNARVFMTNYEQSLREMTKLFEQSNNPFFKSYEIGKADIGGVSTLQVSMDMSAMFEAVGDPNAERMMKLMLGEEGKITAYIAPADATTVVLAYDKDQLAETLGAAKKKTESLATQEEVVATMKLLPKDAQWIAFVSPQGIVETGKTIVAAVAPGGPGELPPFPKTPPIGLGARMMSDGCDTSLVLPKEVLAGIGSYVQMIQQGGGPEGQPGVNGVPPRQKLERR